MLKVTIKEELKKQDKTLHYLSLETKIAYNTLHKLANNKTESVKFEILYKICKVLNCGIEDILKVED